ncbi:EamA family transporter [Streptomyces platensis]|uniref:EamA family transporter n=1 Tax=Streptomyces platensis TaxID=58346 RepID=UPI00378E4663
MGQRPLRPAPRGTAYRVAGIRTALWRPGLRWDRTTLGIAATAGTLLTVHHLSYYEAIDRLPLGAATPWSSSPPTTLALAAAVALLSSVLPYTFHLEALRRLPPRTFGVLTSLEPAVGAVLGLLVLGQHLAVPQWAGVLAVALSSVGATRTPNRASPCTARRAPRSPSSYSRDGGSGSWS